LSLAIACWCAIALNAPAQTKTIARCGAGFLEEINGHKVLHVKGTPYEMGYQQGALLKGDIRDQVRFLFDVKAKELKLEVAGFKVEPDPKKIIAAIAESQRKFVPDRFFEELRGVADGSGMKRDEIVVANFIPELFHCSGFALAGSATKNGTLYHGRILDYGVDWRLQEHAVVTIAEPAGRNAFANISYCGFIGSVTGMNAQGISVGEMGGRGMGHWAGVPMTVLVRMALEEASSLEEAIATFKNNPRTCQYYYVIADGKAGKAVGMEGSWNICQVIQMGETHPLLPQAFPDTVLLSAGDRYEELCRRVKANLGTFDAQSARALMNRPVAMKSNLHSVLFESRSSRFWVANASKEGEPAASQPYQEYQLTELLKHVPDSSAPVIPQPPTPPATTTAAAAR
jgi:hypothetical protein